MPQRATRAKVILSGEIKRKVALKGIAISKGARAAIEAAGGSVELPPEAPPAGQARSQEGRGRRGEG